MWNFGPMREIGESTVNRQPSFTTYIYDCEGESIQTQGTATKVWLHLEATQWVGSPDVTISFSFRTSDMAEVSRRSFVVTR